MKEKLADLIKEFVGPDTKFVVEHPTNLTFGDYSTNAGIISKNTTELFAYLEKNQLEEVERIEIKNGFINFYLTKKFFADSLKEIIEKGKEFGKNESLKGEKVMVEYTDPNPFKEFHIGHLMSNTIGESIARLYEWNDAEVKRACYQGDVGLHVAKAIWGFKKRKEEGVEGFIETSLAWERYVSKAYATGNAAYESDPEAKLEIIKINKEIYSGVAGWVKEAYNQGREWSLNYFKNIYKKLGTNFDFNFFESECAEFGKKIVLDNPGIFVESDGAFVFNAAEHDKSLHTRVFINSEGLPTYEAKELGLANFKYERYPYTRSVVITGNEINDYFRVLLQAMKLIFPDLANVTEHLSHGMLRLSSGKMSSRTGDVITAESLIEEVKDKVKGNEAVAVGAIKYMILRASIGGDIVFDVEKSVSTEGDSGVYLQYAHARARTLLEKAGVKGDPKSTQGDVREVEKLLYRFPEIVARALNDYAPHYITTYLTELASSFNNFYAHEQVIGDSIESSYRLAIVEAFKIVMQNGLNILGIPAPERM